jgi:hypothetical protein
MPCCALLKQQEAVFVQLQQQRQFIAGSASLTMRHPYACIMLQFSVKRALIIFNKALAQTGT